MEISIKNIFEKADFYLGKKIIVNGWIRNCRFQKKLIFIELNDGTFLENFQIVYKNVDLEKIKDILQIGTSLKVEGFLKKNEKQEKNLEILAQNITLLGSSDFSYPIQPKKHSKSFLRTIPHLRTRTKLFGAVFRIRSTAFFALHHFFHKKGFFHINTPIITPNDGEGAGELFQLTSLNLERLSQEKPSTINYQKDFFGKKVFLTVTGQLEAEAMALALNKVYTFGPTFRAEKSNTPRHAAEFWMLEPEMAFCDLKQNLKVAQEMLQEVVVQCLQENQKDIEFLDQTVRNGLLQELKNVVQEKEFLVITYQKAIEILASSGVAFENKVFYGSDLATEHEKFLTEKHFQKPVFIIDWPKEIKAFYMKNNPDQKTVAAMDLLIPRVGELIGGSQREENLAVLIEKMQQMKIPQKEFEWYLDLRRFGSCIHSGFGLGFERLLLFLTGLDNIRDVIAFPRTY
ncbi:Asparaginyl-tRNA synthetase [Candidatus Phytoplasma australiense]|uniref:Asparagine--tRNA ligase n=1 Tax=Phytoplasma australiense TaxID=59748 RepID=SYN_PHYAS|nr:RecName: Full=Asparagine--tRNA ligase; AltName: Full=Asparaginyl-tRNA synthetase; Short=AsnRS [Candidatus Phytoplasma australiense]CAM11361.1 Asparaginyl-tRNA synthetase [Candidatus Phytoplasma australiense]